MPEIYELTRKDTRPERNVLIVVAHPDDETLGAGATMHRLSRAGAGVHVCILSGDVEARNLRPVDGELRGDTLQALTRLGVATVEFGSFPNIRMNTVPHLELVQFIESAIERVNPTAVITHHPGDINDDHRQVSSACQAAIRLPQRRQLPVRIERLLFMEVLSSTDWAFGADQFQPNYFHEVSSEDVQAKVEALALYRGVMRPHPHPRSAESLFAQSTLRGSQAGVDAAEAFHNVFTLTRDLLR